MHIESSRIQARATHSELASLALAAAVGSRAAPGAGSALGDDAVAEHAAPVPVPTPESTRVTLSDAARARVNDRPAAAARNAPRRRHDEAHAEYRGCARHCDGCDDGPDALDGDPSLRMLRQVVEWLTGRRVRVFDASVLSSTDSDAGSGDSAAASAAGSASSRSADAASGSSRGAASQAALALAYRERESTRVSVQGSVHTADGRDIAFSLDLSMQRDYSVQLAAVAGGGDAPATDPLVVNFGGRAAELSDKTFTFDLDADGSAETLRAPSSGSGFLVFDRNGNGQVDDASELFGPSSGDGFGDLAKLDADGNGWIDDADPAFARLATWDAPERGTGTLATLASHGVGALSTTAVASRFALKDAANAMLGQLRVTGVSLTESGQVGSLQQVDLVA